MAAMEEMQTAMVNRSIRTIKAELEYLCDASIISPQTLSQLLSAIPPQTALHAPCSVGAVPTANPVSGALQSPTPAMQHLGLNNPVRNGAPTNGGYNGGMNEKQDHLYQPAPSPQPPPAYDTPPPQANWPPLAQATALYAYTSTDDGDLELQPNDHVTVTEYMNSEWWKGRSTRTGREGIFPRSYVKVIDEKGAQPNSTASNSKSYGNAPLEVANGGNNRASEAPSKTSAAGKSAGKKVANSAMFGFGATLGSKVANSIF